MDFVKSMTTNDTVQGKIKDWFGGDKDDAEGEAKAVNDPKSGRPAYSNKDTAPASNSTRTAAPAPSAAVHHAPRMGASPEMSGHTASGCTATSGLPLPEQPVVAAALPKAVADSCLPAIAHRLARLLIALQQTSVLAPVN